VPPEWLSGPDYENLIALVAHEFFHVWLGKRIRPEPLGPFDYLRENYTRNLWVVEGFTTYYTDLILLRAGLMTRERYLERLGDAIARLQALPGRHHQSLEESSFDTWIRFYRPDAHTPNSQISYYQKGALVAMALDLEIRLATGGERSLDDVMRTTAKAVPITPVTSSAVRPPTSRATKVTSMPRLRPPSTPTMASPPRRKVEPTGRSSRHPTRPVRTRHALRPYSSRLT
jgi:predicted metalloprotease with PDZ domain